MIPSPSSILCLRFQLETLLASPRSLTGTQLDQLRQGYVPTRGGAHPDGQAKWRIFYMDLLRLCRALDEDEEGVCRLRYGTPAGLEAYERRVAGHAVQRQDWGEGAPVLGTAQGEELVQLGQGGTCRVQGLRVRFLSYLEIAQQRECSVWQVRQVLGSALDKVHRALVVEEDLVGACQEEA